MKKIVLLSLLVLTMQGVYSAENTLSQQATAFYSDNNYNETMNLLLQIKEDERTAQDWLILGNVLADKGEVENAVFMYQKAISTDPKFYKAYYNLANYYVERGQFNLAISNYKKAIKLKQDNPYIYYNLACAQIKQKELKKARANLNKAIMYKSDVPEFHYTLAYVYKELKNEKNGEIYLKNYKKLTGTEF